MRKVTFTTLDGLVDFLNNNHDRQYNRGLLSIHAKMPRKTMNDLLDIGVADGRITKTKIQKTSYQSVEVFSSINYVQPPTHSENKLKNIFLRGELKQDKAYDFVMERVNREREAYKASSVNLD